MKSKLKEFIQHLYHEVEDETKAEEYIDTALPLIGLIVMYFNSLESSLDSILCENFTDKTDSTGLIVISGLNYSSKVELFKRFLDNFQIDLNIQFKEYTKLIENLKKSAQLRNLVVHANWESMNEEGFAYVKLKMSKNEMHQEYIQFDNDSLQKIIELILETQNKLHNLWDERNKILYL